ncbi:MAG: HD domain-containing protein [Deltaproteobacteria bacterium]|nr:HD domain-containing protein [Deltaproteobacteria bacterium]
MSLSLSDSPARPLLELAARLARDRGQRLWLAGGVVRDLLLGLSPCDVDLAVAGDALDLGRALAAATGARFVLLSARDATCRLVSGALHLDLAGLRAPDIRGDLGRRDFTINALALELGDALAGRGEILDPTGGQADLAARLLRPAGPGVLADDPLRVLRGFRFLAALDLSPAPGVLAELAAAGPGLFRVAAERVGQEWLALMAGPAAPRAVAALEEAQVLTRLVPELALGRGMLQNPYHHLDVFRHNLATLAAVGDIAARPAHHFGPGPPDLAGEVADYLAHDRRRALLATAALLHDLGKPATRREKAPGWATFYNHDQVGAALARARVRALGLSRADAERVALLVAGHMRPFQLLGAARRGRLTNRAVRRQLTVAGRDLAGLMVLAMADTLAGKGPDRPPEAEEQLAALCRRVVELRDRSLAAALAAPPLLDGRRLMAGLGLRPGPLVGRLLGLVREAQLDGKIATAEEALALARRLAGSAAN